LRLALHQQAMESFLAFYLLWMKVMRRAVVL
jgi:hypothetical protein